MPEYLSEQKELENLTYYEAHYDLNNDRTINLSNVFALIVYTAQRQKLRFLLNGILYVAYEQEIYSLLTLRFHKFEKTQSVKL
ncbi:hypothetical protein MSIBF_A3760004 [groundwater metagenome]|uniref:Uncharacterized protein n=1 Tax=groundwater metagenome TaxID=717931 RepID=A0A098EBI2_9ZZZZ